jgi:hypothetical protein
LSIRASVAYHEHHAIIDIGSPEPHRLQIAVLYVWEEIRLREICFD